MVKYTPNRRNRIVARWRRTAVSRQRNVAFPRMIAAAAIAAIVVAVAPVSFTARAGIAASLLVAAIVSVSVHDRHMSVRPGPTPHYHQRRG